MGGLGRWRIFESRCLRLCLQIDRRGAFLTAAGGLFGDIRAATAGKAHTVRVPRPRARPCSEHGGEQVLAMDDMGKAGGVATEPNRTGKVMLDAALFRASSPNRDSRGH